MTAMNLTRKLAAIAAAIALTMTTAATCAEAAPKTPRRTAAVASPTVQDVPYVPSGTAQQRLTVTWDPARTSAPWVFVVHGGYWYAGDRDGMSDVVSSFYSRGYQVFNVEYRHDGVDGDVRFQDQLDDLAAAARFIHSNYAAYRIARSNGVIYGSSAGGHLAASYVLWKGGFAAAVTMAGILQPDRVATDVLTGQPDDDQPVTDRNRKLYAAEVQMTGEPYTAASAPWRAFRPETRLATPGGGKPAFYVVHGLSDGTAPYRMTDHFRDAAVAQDYTVKAVFISGGGHSNAILIDGGARESAMHSWLTGVLAS